MEYSFDVCHLVVFLSDDKKGCALIVMPDKKKLLEINWIGCEARNICNRLSNVKKP
jgi:hypothetical protein